MVIEGMNAKPGKYKNIEQKNVKETITRPTEQVVSLIMHRVNLVNGKRIKRMDVQG